MQGAASCQALLAGGEPGVGGCHKSSRTRQSFHLGFRTDPRVFLPGLSEEFPPLLTPLICFILPPSAFLASSWKQKFEPGEVSPSQPRHQPTSERPKRVRKAPVHLRWAGWSGHRMSPTPSPSLGGSLQSCRNTQSHWLERTGARPAHQASNWVEGAPPELGIPRLHLIPPFSSNACSPHVCRRALRCG